MELLEFSVTNYRSITAANRITLKNLTVLVGKNNEGKSNLLTALNIAMTTIAMSSKTRLGPPSRMRDIYDWDRDFPVQLKERQKGKESIFKLTFRLTEPELCEFKSETGIRGNSDIHIVVKYGPDSRNPNITIPKKGTNSYTKKYKQVLEFISKRISFNYIQAVRTEGMALSVLRDVIWSELRQLEDDVDYRASIEKISELQQNVLNQISLNLIDPLKIFLPQLQGLSIKSNLEYVSRGMRNDIEIMINDGIETSINYKGDGIKSLLTLAILKDRPQIASASIIAIEEPESHLHSGAIHGLVDIINGISEKNQVILTTHNPLFVQQNSLKSNIIVDGGTAKVAKSISEIRNTLGVLPSDNLRNSNNVLLVEGEDDKMTLIKILSSLSKILKNNLKSNNLVIKSIGGASNLSHDLNDLKHCMCKYFVLLDNDDEGRKALGKAKANNLLNDDQYKLTITNGTPNAEFEDCLKKDLYASAIEQIFNVNIDCPQFKSNAKWSDRLKNTFSAQGSQWNDKIEQKVKMLVAELIPENIQDISTVLIGQKSGYIYSLVTALEAMLSTD